MSTNFSSPVVHWWIDCVLRRARSVLGAEECVLAEPLCSAKASAAGVRQQWAALFCLLIMYGVEETVDFLKKTREDAILFGDHADFSHSHCFLTQCSEHFPLVPDTGTGLPQGLWHGGVTWSSQPIWSKLYFSQGRDDPISHSSSAGGSKATAPPCVLSSGCIRKSLYIIHSGNHHLGFCSWDAAREGKLGFWGKQHQGGGSKARSMVHRFPCCPSANW